MVIATILSRAQFGMEAPLVRVEVDVGGGLPAFTIVGLPEAVVKESRDRVRAAIASCHLEVPAGHITVNLAPADLPKEGGRFDLPIALGVLVASEQLPAERLSRCELFGELSLTGELRSIRGALPAALAAARSGHSVILPEENQAEAKLVRRCEVASARHLLEVCAHATGQRQLTFDSVLEPAIPAAGGPDLAEVRGQPLAKRALEIAAAGAHGLIYVGPPGTGKSMLAQRLPGILPPMSDDEALEVAAVHSVAGHAVDPRRWRIRPFRSPHHTTSAIALVGGGSHPRPGEISLAHNGVLFLDELPEFERRVLEALREPLETGSVTVSRAARQAEFPARFQLVAAMTPCPCGHLGDDSGRCRCALAKVQRYRSRVSGPLLDRIDLQVEVPRPPARVIAGPGRELQSSAEVATRVVRARAHQLSRQGCLNARLENAQVDRFCDPGRRGRELLERAMRTLGFSARGYYRILRIARTIADLRSADGITLECLSEALSLRRLDRRESGQH